eukprot:RCo035389
MPRKRTRSSSLSPSSPGSHGRSPSSSSSGSATSSTSSSSGDSSGSSSHQGGGGTHHQGTHRKREKHAPHGVPPTYPPGGQPEISGVPSAPHPEELTGEAHAGEMEGPLASGKPIGSDTENAPLGSDLEQYLSDREHGMVEDVYAEEAPEQGGRSRRSPAPQPHEDLSAPPHGASEGPSRPLKRARTTPDRPEEHTPERGSGLAHRARPHSSTTPNDWSHARGYSHGSRPHNSR